MEEEKSFETIQITAHNGFGIEAIKCGVLDYILKLISINELKTAIEKFRKLQSLKEGACFDKIESSKIKIDKLREKRKSKNE